MPIPRHDRPAHVRFGNIVPDTRTEAILVQRCKDQLGEAWEPNYWLWQEDAEVWRAWCKDPGHYCYAMVEVDNVDDKEWGEWSSGG